MSGVEKDFSDHMAKAMKFSEMVMKEGLHMKDRDIASVNAIIKELDESKMKRIIKENSESIKKIGRKIENYKRDKNKEYMMETENTVRALAMFCSFIDPERDKDHPLQFTDKEKEFLEEEVIKNLSLIAAMSMDSD